ncbi:retinol dehydrogenase 13-like [Stomoxys calcitrans]|uniref:retinol dehydrogenase 13-like n=1 Tax=Stomoxys calcitrans TaxID=35570 RepID=UPI0027E377FC|nr:retinol dehydrogenase 13-like [Stomoxys calcitrans]
MKVTDFLNRILCRDKVQVACLEGGPIFEFGFWSLATFLSMWLFYKWREGPFYQKSNRIDGKVVIVTGSNTGIGKEIALELAKRGGRVYLACRDYQKCENARQDIMDITGNPHVYNRTLDLASLQSVREFAANFNQEEEHLDILINNAGIMAPPRSVTIDGYEQQFAVNHLGHFLLTNLLLEKLKASAPSRIVVVSSMAHAWGHIQKEDINSEKSYNAFKVYGQSKLANILFTRKLAQILKESRCQVDVNCLHPGVVQSELTRNNALMSLGGTLARKLFWRSTKAGAQTALYLALDPELKGVSGGYYDRMALTTLSKKAGDDEMADWLWRKSEEMVAEKKKN